MAPVCGALLAPGPSLDGRAVGRVDGCCRRRAHRREVRGGRTQTGTADDLYAVCRAHPPPSPSCASHRICPPGVPPPAGMAGRCSETVTRARGDALYGARGARCRPRCVAARVHAVSHGCGGGERARYVWRGARTGAPLAQSAHARRACASRRRLTCPQQGSRHADVCRAFGLVDDGGRAPPALCALWRDRTRPHSHRACDEPLARLWRCREAEPS